MNQKAVSVIGIVGLILIVFIVLGFSKKDMAPPQGTNTITQPTPTPVPSTPGDNTTGSISAVDKAALLAFKLEKATPEESAAHHDLLVRLAVKTDTIQIGAGCESKPFIIKTELNKTITISNIDSIKHTLKFFNTDITIEPSETKTVEADFGHGEGLEGYMCDPAGQPGEGSAGMVQIGEFK